MQKLKLFEKEKEKEKTFEKFEKKLKAKLDSTATAKSWSDLLPILKDIASHLMINKDYDFDKLKIKLLLGKRLAQGLNPECPSGLHEITLEVYCIILNNIISKNDNKLKDNLHIYAYGLFPFFPNATIPLKKKFLEKIVKDIFIKLNNTELKICLPGLLSSLIPGLDDNNEETTKNIYSSFDDLAKKDEHTFFGVYWMLLLRCQHLRNSGIKYLLEKLSKYNDIKDLSLDKQEEIINKHFPNINSTVVNALCEIIKDKEIPVVRNGMDFISTRLPLSKDNNMIKDEAKINLINSILNLYVRNEQSTIRRAKNYILGIQTQDDEVEYESEDMNYKMGLVITAFKNIFKSEKNLETNIIKNNIIMFERFLDSDEEFVNKILSSIALPLLKSAVNYWEKNLESSEEALNEPIISQITKFFDKNDKFRECLWNSLASSLILEYTQIKNIDEIISPLKFCLIYILIDSNKKRIRYYIPIITNILNLIKQIPIKREEFKIIKKVVMIALAYIKSLQETQFQQLKEEESKNEIIQPENKLSSDNWIYVETPTPSMRKSVLNKLKSEDDEEIDEESNITDVYQINNEANLNSILNCDKELLENLSSNISKYQEYYIEILNLFFVSEKSDKKAGQITKFEIGFFRLIAELTIRLQEYNQPKENEIPAWIKYLEKIIFNHCENNTYNTLSIEAANIILDLNLSFSQKEKNSIYTKIRKNFDSEDIDTQIIDKNSLNDIIQKMNVKINCYELLFAKFYLLSNTQTHMNSIMKILQKIFYFDKNKFNNIINDTFNIQKNFDENIKLFSNFWKSVNDYNPEEKMFHPETVFKMLDLLEERNPTLRHLSKTWLNQNNQRYNKIIDPILLVLLDQNILFTINESENGEQSEFIREFNITKILDALNKFRNIIINTQIIDFLKTDLKSDIYSMIRFKKYEKSKINYLQGLICTLLHYIRTKPKKESTEEFVKDVFSLNAASTETLEFLLKNINDYDFLICNTKFINDTILSVLMKSLAQKNEVMSVQLLEVLKTLYFNYPPEFLKIPKYKTYYINLLMNPNLEEIIKEGMVYDHFYIRDHFISFTNKLVESFFNYITIDDKGQLKDFYQLCNKIIEPLFTLLTQKVKFENAIKIDTEKFSHYDGKHANIIYKNYCEEYKEYKTYDESEVLSILNGINDILSKCFTNQIQEKNKGMGTDQGIKLFAIPIPFIKKKAIIKTDFRGNWQEHKNQLANLLKSDNPFISFFTTSQIFDFWDKNPNKEIRDMSSNLYHNQIFNLLSSFLYIWINQSDKYEKFDYCLNPNGILPLENFNYFIFRTNKLYQQAKESWKNNAIKNVIISISQNLFLTDSIKFIENIIYLWSQDFTSEFKTKDKQYKLSIIELLTALDIPMDVIIFCISSYLQKTFENNNAIKKYVKSKPNKCYKTPLDVGIREGKIFHLIYSYILLNPNSYLEPINNAELLEIWKEVINLIKKASEETKIINSICWLYEILQLTSKKYSIYNFDYKDIKSDIENVFTNLTSKLTDAIFNNKTDSKFINDSKLMMPFLPHVYTNIVKELYKEDDLYHINLEGGKSDNSGFNHKSFKSKMTIDDKKALSKTTIKIEKFSIDLTKSTKSSSQKLEKEEFETSINDFYEDIIDAPRAYEQIDAILDEDNPKKSKKLIDVNTLNSYYEFMAFITLKENFYPLIYSLFKDKDNKMVSKFYSDIISKLLKLILNENGENRNSELAHKFLGNLMEKSPKNVSTSGKDDLIAFIKSDKIFKGTASELHEWKNIINLFKDYYKDILKDLFNDMDDKNIFVKTTEQEKSKTLRRISFVIYSCERDDFQTNFSLIKSKTKDLLTEFSTNSSLEKEIFLLLRMLFLKFSHDAVMQMIRDLWAIIFTELVKNINNYIINPQGFKSVLESFKFIELLSIVNIEEFSLYQWIFLLDTFDVKDCDIRIDSLLKKLLIDKESLFKPLSFEILKSNMSNIEDHMLEDKKRAKNELIIDAEDEKNFNKQLSQFFYSIGDINSFKVEWNYEQISKNIENDFIYNANSYRRQSKKEKDRENK